MSGNVHDAILVERREIARQIEELVFALGGDETGQALVFRPGQFVSLRVGQDADGAAILRSYSIASRPGEPRFALVIKRVPGGVATTYLDTLGIGDVVRMTGPMGFFVLELAHAGDVALGVTGVGIAPVLSMLEELLARDERGHVHLLWGNRLGGELFWNDELARLASPRLTMRRFLSGDGEADGKAGHERGRMSQPLLELAPTLTAPTFYLVGSGAMIKEVKTGLVAQGFDRKRQIRNEAFFE